MEDKTQAQAKAQVQVRAKAHEKHLWDQFQARRECWAQGRAEWEARQAPLSQEAGAKIVCKTFLLVSALVLGAYLVIAVARAEPQAQAPGGASLSASSTVSPYSWNATELGPSCESMLKRDLRLVELATRVGVRPGPLGPWEMGLGLCNGETYNLVDLLNAVLDQAERGK